MPALTREDVLEAERAYAAAAHGGAFPAVDPALVGAVASHYLAVGTPRSLGLVGAGAEASLAAHATWFSPRDVRCFDCDAALVPAGRAVTLAEALAADIVCIHAPLALAASQLRRGTHVNALAAVTLDADLTATAHVTRHAGLPALAAGIIDGRQLDELTIFLLQ